MQERVVLGWGGLLDIRTKFFTQRMVGHATGSPGKRSQPQPYQSSRSVWTTLQIQGRIAEAAPCRAGSRSLTFPGLPLHAGTLPRQGWPCPSPCGAAGALGARPAWGGAGRPQVRGAAGGGPGGGRGSPRDTRAGPHLSSGVGVLEPGHRVNSRHHACQRGHQVHQVPALRLQLHFLGEVLRAASPAPPGVEPAGQGWRGGR